jgi:peptidyl-prolyl cis-trans isomerase SurA
MGQLKTNYYFLNLELKKMKLIIVFLFVSIFNNVVFAQKGTIATIGKEKVSTEEFLWAYNKNNRSEQSKAAAVKEYLNLHINYRLKVQEAYRLRYDTTPEKKAEFKQLYSQMAEKYLNNDNVTDPLVREAFKRLQTKIEVAHIFIALGDVNNAPQTKGNYDKALEALKKLRAGEDFKKIVVAYSNDSYAEKNGGYLGFISAFTLPYTFENAIYNTPAGSYTDVIKSNTGYHIFKVISVSKEVGQIVAQQILIAADANGNSNDKVAVRKRADSIYNVLIKSPNKFDSLAFNLSQDQSSNYKMGYVSPFIVGSYDALFEKTILQTPLKTVSPVFETENGFHIVKPQAYSLMGNTLTELLYDSLKNVVNEDTRGRNVRTEYFKKLLPKIGYKANSKLSINQLGIIASNIAEGQDVYKNVAKGIDSATLLHSYPKLNVTVGDFVKFYKIFRFSGLYKGQTTDKVIEEYAAATAKEYYLANYADYNKEFGYLMKEFKDGSLYFDFMTNKVWNAASDDTPALQKYFNANKNKYKWKPGVAGIVVTANNQKDIYDLKNQITANSKNWKIIVEKFGDNARADSGRYEYENLINQDPFGLIKGSATEPKKINEEGWYSFMFVTEQFSNEEQRSFTDARGLVANDYQTVLDEQIIKTLKVKNPVKINNAELTAISK